MQNHTIPLNDTTIVLPHQTTPFITQSLDILGISAQTHTHTHAHAYNTTHQFPRMHTHTLTPFDALTFDELYTIEWNFNTSAHTHTHTPTPTHREGVELSPSRSALWRVRERMTSIVQHTHTHTRVHRSCDCVVLVSRNSDRLSGHKSRAIVNENALIRTLRSVAESRSLQLYVFRGDSESLYDTIKVFARACAVIGAHGAGMSNMVYSGVGTHVIEVAMYSARHRDYMHMANSLGHHYWVAEAHRNALESPIHVNVTTIAHTLEAALRRMGTDTRTPPLGG